MKRRILSLLLCLVMVIGVFPAAAMAGAAEPAEPGAAAKTITVYLNISKNGEIVSGKESTGLVARKPVELSGKSEYTIDDALREAHKLFHAEGETAYGSENGTYGLNVNKLWGVATYNVQYQLNSGTINVLDLSTAIKDGDIIDAYLTQSLYPDTEAYTVFDKSTASAVVGKAIELSLSSGSYDENGGGYRFSPCSDAKLTIDGVDTAVTTDENGKASLTFEQPGRYIISAKKTKTVNEAEVTVITAAVCEINVTYPDACITVPADATLFVGEKPVDEAKKVMHFVPFKQKAAAASVSNEDGTKSYYYDLTKNSTYNYRVSGEDYITYAGTFKKTANYYSLTVTEAQLRPVDKSKSTIDRNVASNSGYNTADIYLNINPQGYLKLDGIGSTYQLINLRSWEAIDTITNNYFIEPDYHYTVISETGTASDVVSVSESGLITAKNKGTAIVLVTYDAINVRPAVGGPFFGAIWPENTGVFVVSVGAEESGIETGMTVNAGKNTNADTGKQALDALDAEHDVIYFLGERGSYSFTPLTNGLSVFVANPTVTDSMSFSDFTPVSANENGSYTVPLKEGRNIVKLEKAGNAEYQVITAKKLAMSVNGGKFVAKGDPLNITFSGLYHPAQKLAGVYNMNAVISYTTPDNKQAGSKSAQYNFASNSNAQTVKKLITRTEKNGNVSYGLGETLVVPANFEGENYILSQGSIITVGYGDPYGNHRGITLENGKAPNLNASVKEAYLGVLPDIVIPVYTLDHITVTTDPVRMAYNAGDVFDPAGMVVTANYGDDRNRVITDYSYEPAIFAGQEGLNLSYTQGNVTKTTTVAITVREAVLERIEVSTKPTKIAYKAMESFDPSGMVVTAHYSDDSTAEIKNYTSAPDVLRTSDSSITVSYAGKTTTVAVEVTGRVLKRIDITKDPTKLSYYVGDVFDPAGMEITASYNDDTTDVVTHLIKMPNTPFTSAGEERIKFSYTENGETKSVKLSVTVEERVAPAPGPVDPEPETITVRFTLLGDDKHGDSGELHTLKSNNLTSWISNKSVTMAEGSTVAELVTKVLNQSRIPFVNESGNYISSIRGLAELDNGLNSGWMYTLNGKHGRLGVNEQLLRNGDVVVFHYTDDYTIENSNEDWGGRPGVPADPSKPAEEKPVAKPNSFKDIENCWAADAIQYAYENGLMKGIGDDNFDPEGIVSRAMVVTCLYRIEKEPEAKASNPFADIEEGKWYTAAVLWAAENGIVEGYGSRFNPDATLSREQFAVMLYNYALYKKYDVSKANDLAGYEDAAEISSWAKAAMQWANAEGLITGRTETALAPGGVASRAEMASLMQRFCEGVAK